MKNNTDVNKINTLTVIYMGTTDLYQSFYFIKISCKQQTKQHKLIVKLSICTHLLHFSHRLQFKDSNIPVTVVRAP